MNWMNVKYTGMKYTGAKSILAALLLAAPALALGQQVVNQGAPSLGHAGWKVQGAQASGSTAAQAGNPTLVGGSDGTNVRTLRTDTNGVTQTQQANYVAAGAPTFGGAANNVTTVSTSFCSLTSGATYRVSCSAPVKWRTGAATPTALTTDNDFFGPLSDWISLGATDTCIAFITSAGTATCSGTLRRTVP